jgi:hypothetical protein
MPNPLTTVAHPVEAWRAFVQRVDARGDAEAIAAGLTVEVVPNGVRRCRDPRLDRLGAQHVAAQPADTARRSGTGQVAGSWSTPTLTVAAGWSR